MPKKQEKETIEDLKQQLKEMQKKISNYAEPTPYEVKQLYSWKAPQRLFVLRNKKWYTYIILLVMNVTLVLLFLQQFIIIAPVLAIAFVAYVLASVPAEEVEHKITNQGINTSGHSYLWMELVDFWLTKKNNETFIHIDTYLDFPRRIVLLLGQGNLEEIKKHMVQYIPYRELPKLSWMDRVSDFLVNKFHKFAS